MNKISEHFSREEFTCACCKMDTVDVELIKVLEHIRNYFEQPIFVNSGCRCERYNTRIGGKSNSFHLISKAADIVVKDTQSEDVVNYLKYKFPEKYGIGLYDSFVHIDVRDVKARWSDVL